MLCPRLRYLVFARYVRMKYGAVYTTDAILVYKSLKSIDATNRFVVTTVPVDVRGAMALSAVIHFTRRVASLRGFYDMLHPILVPSVGRHLAPELLGSVMHRKKYVRSVLRVHCPRRPIDFLVTSQCSHGGSVMYRRGDWHRGNAICPQILQYAACLLGRHAILDGDKFLEYLVIGFVQQHLCQFGQLGGYFIEINAFKYLLVLLFPVHVMHHDALFEQMIEATLVLTQHVLHLDVHHPLHEVLHNGGSLHVTALHGSGNQISSLHDAHQHTYVAAYDVIYQIT